MFQWRLKLREARLALQAGRFEEARRLLDDHQLRDFLPARELASQMAAKYAERAQQRIAWGESSAGLADLYTAEELGGAEEAAQTVRHDYTRRVAVEAIAKLSAAEPEAALRRLQLTRRRGVATPLLRDAEELAEAWVAARKRATIGDMADALAKLTAAHHLASAFDASATACDNSALGGIRHALGLGSFGLGRMKVAGAVDREEKLLTQKAAEHQAARERLHAAAAAKEWDNALSAVDEVLRLAAADQVAISLRRRLWKELGLGLTQSHRANPSGPIANGHQPAANPPNKRITPLALQDNEAMPVRRTSERNRQLGQSLRAQAAGASPNDQPARMSTRPSKPSTSDTAAGSTPVDRRMLWVDAVGGYLVCLDDAVMLGQPNGGGASPAIPILADISRRHAILRREAGAYVLEPLGPVLLDGQPITGPAVLGDSHLIQLNAGQPGAAQPGTGKPATGATVAGVQIRFTRPHALSATARLEIESGHRTTPSADGVLLMAESCILGPNTHSHIRCKDWKEDVILFRQGEGLACRSSGELSVDGKLFAGPAPIGGNSRIEGEDFAISSELA
ncbi:MAG: FHA domain-containing protein [Planctomycetota bacterium]